MERRFRILFLINLMYETKCELSIYLYNSTRYENQKLNQLTAIISK